MPLISAAATRTPSLSPTTLPHAHHPDMLRQLCPRFSPVRGRGQLVAATLWLAWLCSVIAVSEEASPRALLCPDEADILPCVCTVYLDLSMDMDCSTVTSSNELARVFSANFPFPDFYTLIINQNPYITDLRIGDLGEATFQYINITHGRLQSVVSGALSGSYNTLRVLDLTDNSLNDFPFDELSSFPNLDQILFEENVLSPFPDIYSSSLRMIFMGDNPVRTISSTALQNLPNLEVINLENAQLTYVEPGTFTGLSKLEVVNLAGNYLTYLKTGTIEVTGSINYVYLNYNRLSIIAVNAIVGARYLVSINYNYMTELDEAVWRPMFDNDILLFARDNPLACGCDIAWIVLNANYLENLMGNPACSDGQLIIELDPAFYSEFC